MAEIIVRRERANDIDAVYAINCAAFPADDEAKLADSLREQAPDCISMVAELEAELLGHLMLSPVMLDSAPHLRIMGLAPMAVLPDQQNQGIGSKLVQAGLRCCESSNVGAVVVLGHPRYYPRFGFVPAVNYHIKSGYDVPADVFMIQELIPQFLSGHAGTIAYHSAFAAL